MNRLVLVSEEWYQGVSVGYISISKWDSVCLSIWRRLMEVNQSLSKSEQDAGEKKIEETKRQHRGDGEVP